MKLETLNALAEFADEVTRAIRGLQDGNGADTSALSDAKQRLCDALEVENVERPKSHD